MNRAFLVAKTMACVKPYVKVLRRVCAWNDCDMKSDICSVSRSGCSFLQ